MRLGIMIGIAAMATVVVASNILVQFLFGDWLTWGAFTYPVAFLVTDLTNRTYGPRSARKVVFAGFVVGIACSFAGNLDRGRVRSIGYPQNRARIGYRVSFGPVARCPGIRPAASRPLVACAAAVVAHGLDT